jgi:hypothetical protein
MAAQLGHPDAFRRFGTTTSAPTLLERWPIPMYFYELVDGIVLHMTPSRLAIRESVSCIAVNLIATDARMRRTYIDADPKSDTDAQRRIVESCADRRAWNCLSEVQSRNKSGTYGLSLCS